jgi:hypothetical protein
LGPAIKASLPASERPKSNAVFVGFCQFSVAPPLLSARWRAWRLRSPGAATTPALRAVLDLPEPSKQSTAADGGSLDGNQGFNQRFNKGFKKIASLARSQSKSSG